MKKLITFFKKLFKSDNKENNTQLIWNRYDGENIYYTVIYYYNNGKSERVVNKKNNILHGTTVYFIEDGQISLIIDYIDGQCIKTHNIFTDRTEHITYYKKGKITGSKKL